jgi:hypothetical protein
VCGQSDVFVGSKINRESVVCFSLGVVISSFGAFQISTLRMSETEKLALERVHNRIASTSNEDLPKVLEKLLPSLIPFSNNANLQPQVLTIISNITRRMKSLQTSISCSQLLFKLVTPEMMPYACNIAISVIDISIDYIPLSDRELCATAIIDCLDKFGNEYSYQTNSLLSYTLKLLPEIAGVLKNNEISHRVRGLISSWFLDVSLIQPGLKKDGVGSIQPGLSKERVARLTAKIDNWGYSMLNEMKTRILESIDVRWANPSCVVAISVICSCDPIPDVAKLGGYKLSSMKTALQQAQIPFHPILISLLHLCSLGYEETQNLASFVDLSPLERDWLGWTASDSLQFASTFDSRIATIPGLEFRSPLREDILQSILEWIGQEVLSSINPVRKLELLAPREIDGVSLSVLQLTRRLFSNANEFRSSVPISPKSLSACLELVTTWLQRYVSVDDLAQGATILKRTCVRALSRYLKTQNAVTSNFGQEEVDLILKRVFLFTGLVSSHLLSTEILPNHRSHVPSNSKANDQRRVRHRDHLFALPSS